MSNKSTIHEVIHLQKGDYCPPSKTNLRSPCPLVNALANHGHIPRDGRNIRYNDLHAALGVTGLSNVLKLGIRIRVSH